MRLLALFVVALMAGCDRSESGRPVEVGHIDSSAADDEFKALRLEADELNKDASQLPQGRTLLIRHASGGDSPDAFGAQATRLLALDHVTGLIGGNRWQDAEKLGAALQTEKAIAVCPAGWAGPTPATNLFCVGLAPSERGRALALVALEAKPKHIVIFRDPAAKSACLAADEFVKDVRGPSISITEINVADAKKLEADVVFFACSAAQTLRLCALSMYQSLLLFGEEAAQIPALLAAGKASERIQVATACAPEGKSLRLSAFKDRYRQAYQEAPTLAAIRAHDALAIWVEAARRAGSYDADALRSALLKRDQPFETLTGPLIFADDHTCRRPIFIGKLANGQVTEVRKIDPAAPNR